MITIHMERVRIFHEFQPSLNSALTLDAVPHAQEFFMFMPKFETNFVQIFNHRRVLRLAGYQLLQLLHAAAATSAATTAAVAAAVADDDRPMRA
jgi:hypothetical protein